MRASRGGCRLVLPALAALALVVAPVSLSVDGLVVTKAYADKGGGGHGGGGGNGSGGGNSGNGGGNSGGNSGNGNSGGNNGKSNNGTSSSAGAAGTADVDSHVNAVTGDKVEATSSSIQVTHRNGMKETIENGRFRMEDKYGRTIVDRRATMADLNRLKNL
ncbi:hypothetical protein [Mesorhizobium sp. B1-1-5]|uniref:hypothetical protein n=1 Tax=Mesorhizobium sp. B1-1-5 TaxID=2589979 RepID=UPI00112E3B2A|nr:hypothetical protein [Mesorhizobium sp. B1-1-5]TPO02505.1 hypothetical protein FJ980_18040 [Mesorhizobium sp. B1-1-5]